MDSRSRPLSPHLTIYRWQIGNTLSILHRLTGLGLSAGLIALAYWLMALAGDPVSYAAAQRQFVSVPGLALLMGWTFAFFYHLLNGVRHLFWDVGLGFGRRQRHLSGWLAVGGAICLTLLVWIVILRTL